MTVVRRTPFIVFVLAPVPFAFLLVGAVSLCFVLYAHQSNTAGWELASHRRYYDTMLVGITTTKVYGFALSTFFFCLLARFTHRPRTWAFGAIFLLSVFGAFRHSVIFLPGVNPAFRNQDDWRYGMEITESFSLVGFATPIFVALLYYTIVWTERKWLAQVNKQ